MRFRILILLITCIFSGQSLLAQTTTEQVQLAKEYEMNGDYDKAIDIWKTLYDQNGNANTYYKYYYNALLNSADYKELEKLVRKQMRKFPDNPTYLVDLGRSYRQQNDDAKAVATYEEAVRGLGKDKSQYVQLANAFLLIDEADFAIQTYEKGAQEVKGYSYNYELANLYYRTSQYRRSMETYVEHLLELPGRFNNVCNGLERMLTDDNAHMMLQEIIYARIQNNNDPILIDLLVWDFVQQKDFASAFLQVKALDKRFREDGERVIELAEIAQDEKDYDAAISCYNYVVDKGSGAPYYYVARNGLLNCRRSKITETNIYTREDLLSLKADYLQFLNDYNRADYRAAYINSELAKLDAFYLYMVDSAIARLEQVITWQRLNPAQLAEVKLVLGDLYLIAGDVWESTLIYSQVDKAMKDDPLGEDARFRNARLAYFKGDFSLAQGQLDVLKAATSELVANDALKLSIFITSNLGLDSVAEPMEMYADAELLYFQNRGEAALKRLKDLEKAYPGHPLLDDNYFLRFQIAMKMQRTEDAVAALEYIRENQAFGLLADDALFALGQLYEQQLNNPEQAQLCYEQIILQYKDSIFAAQARKHYRRLRGDAIN